VYLTFIDHRMEKIIRGEERKKMCKSGKEVRIEEEG